MLLTHLGVDPTNATNEVYDIRGVHARFKFLEELYKDHLQMIVDVDDNDM